MRLEHSLIYPKRWKTVVAYNTAQNYLRTFSPLCPHSYATKLFPKRRIAERKPLPPIPCCFLQTPRNQAVFWIHNNIAFRGRGRGKNWYSYDVKKNTVQVYNFLNSFVQDCRSRMRRGGVGNDQLKKKKLAASEMIKASAKGQEEVVS